VRNFTKICWEIHIWLQYFTWRSKYVYIVASSTEYFVLRKMCLGNPLLHFSSNTEHVCIVDSYCRPTAIKRECIVACPKRHSVTYTHVTHLVSVQSGSISAVVINETGQCTVPITMLILRIQQFPYTSEELNFLLLAVLCVEVVTWSLVCVSEDWTDLTKLSEIYASCTFAVVFNGVDLR